MRNENSLSSLQEKVTSMEKVIASMNTTFSTLNATLVDSGLITVRPDLGRHLEKMAQDFHSLANLSADDGLIDHPDSKNAFSPSRRQEQVVLPGNKQHSSRTSSYGRQASISSDVQRPFLKSAW
jgi:hypothetical protein